MTDCPNGDIRDLLPDLLHGRLSSPERERVEAHVATCEECTEELGLLRDLRATMRRVPAVDIAAIAAAIPAYRVPVRRSWAGWRAAAAIATIAIGGTSVAIANRQPQSPAQSSVQVQPVDVGGRAAPAPQKVAQGVARTPKTTEAPSATESTTAARPTPIATTPAVTTPSARELALGSGGVSDLSDRELSTLLNDIESLDALPSADVETAVPLTPLPPTGGGQ